VMYADYLAELTCGRDCLGVAQLGAF
jgi:hypothetical protein